MLVVAVEFVEIERLARLDDLVEIHVFAIDGDHSGAVHWLAVQRHEDVARLQDAIAGTGGDDVGDEYSIAIVRQAQRPAHGRIL